MLSAGLQQYRVLHLSQPARTSKSTVARASKPSVTTAPPKQGRSLYTRVLAQQGSQRGPSAPNALATMPAINEEVASISQSPEWKALEEHLGEVQKLHLRDLLTDIPRCEKLFLEYDGIICDLSRQRVTTKTTELLHNLAEAANLKSKIKSLFAGEHLNVTEDRAVLHPALRAPRDEKIYDGKKNVVPEVWEVLDKIKDFSDKVRSGEWKGVTGKPLTDVVAVGIGGSFLGPLFAHTALRPNGEAAHEAYGRQLRFLANVDPVDVARALNGLSPETTLVVVVSKTFTTSETMLNARTVRTWLTAELGPEATAKHMVAVSTNLKLVQAFGIDPKNAFGFWDWVGGRYSVTSAVGVVPLSLQYGFAVVEEFLQGAWDVDKHFRDAPFEENIPVQLGLASIWNVSFLGYPARAILPYTQALSKLAPHIQQVSMESNGKGVAIDGSRLPFESGEVDFGEPGTNGQHSFYQLIHQGRVIPCEFIGILKSQQSVYLKGEVVSNHDELMCNFFAQADALAKGKSAVELRAENVPDHLIPHKTFTGNRPSLSILLPELNAFTTGQILAMYEHRVAVQDETPSAAPLHLFFASRSVASIIFSLDNQEPLLYYKTTIMKGFVWGINSFDQWGVELGKVLASKVRTAVNACRTKNRKLTPADGFNYSTMTLLNRYLQGKAQLLYPEPRDVFPCELIDGEVCRPPTSYL